MGVFLFVCVVALCGYVGGALGFLIASGTMSLLYWMLDAPPLLKERPASYRYDVGGLRVVRRRQRRF